MSVYESQLKRERWEVLRADDALDTLLREVFDTHVSVSPPAYVVFVALVHVFTQRALGPDLVTVKRIVARKGDVCEPVALEEWTIVLLCTRSRRDLWTDLVVHRARAHVCSHLKN